MYRKTIIYKEKRFHRYPESKHRHLREYYWAHPERNKSPISLHREIYKDAFGTIPEKHVIHHKDGDSQNNVIENLECMSVSLHRKLHTSSEEHKALARKNLAKYAQPKAKLWHGSKGGLAWHKEHAKNTLFTDPKQSFCQECEKKFSYTSIAGGKFCGRKCACRFHDRKRRIRKRNNKVTCEVI